MSLAGRPSAWLALTKGLFALIPVEVARRVLGPEPSARLARGWGRTSPRSACDCAEALRIATSIEHHARLAPNCLRRALLASAISSRAAEMPIYLGLMQAGTPQSGHAWLADSEAAKAHYDVVFAI